MMQTLPLRLVPAETVVCSVGLAPSACVGACGSSAVMSWSNVEAGILSGGTGISDGVSFDTILRCVWVVQAQIESGQHEKVLSWGLRREAGKREFPSHFLAASFFSGGKEFLAVWPPQRSLDQRSLDLLFSSGVERGPEKNVEGLQPSSHCSGFAPPPIRISFPFRLHRERRNRE